jgi:hypothetical protein
MLRKILTVSQTNGDFPAPPCGADSKSIIFAFFWNFWCRSLLGLTGSGQRSLSAQRPLLAPAPVIEKAGAPVVGIIASVCCDNTQPSCAFTLGVCGGGASVFCLVALGPELRAMVCMQEGQTTEKQKALSQPCHRLQNAANARHVESLRGPRISAS